jgi:hypothetical protein
LANINKINLEESFKEAIEAETQQVISETQQTLSEFKSNRDY